MSDQQWRNATPGAWATISGPNGRVTVSALDDGQHRVIAGDQTTDVDGHDEALRLAHELAGR